MKKIVSLSAVTLFGFSITFAACKDKEPAPLPPPLAPSIPNPATPLKPGEITPPPAKSPDKKDLSWNATFKLIIPIKKQADDGPAAGEVGEGEAIAYVVYLNTALRLVDQGNRESARKGILDEHSHLSTVQQW